MKGKLRGRSAQTTWEADFDAIFPATSDALNGFAQGLLDDRREV